jgi:trehalose-phosphatase
MLFHFDVIVVMICFASVFKAYCLCRNDIDVSEVIYHLAQDHSNTVLIISGTTRSILQAAFAHVLDLHNVWLSAENGVVLRPPTVLHTAFPALDKSMWVSIYDNVRCDWVKGVEEVFKYFSARTPGSVVETRETSVAWNYSNSDVEFGKSQAQDMLQHLLTGSNGCSSMDVVRGVNVVEVRAFGVSMGLSISRLIDCMSMALGIRLISSNFIMCMGNFMLRDESIFTFFEGASSLELDASLKLLVSHVH